MVNYDRICKEIFPLMSTWGRAIENDRPSEEHYKRLERIARTDRATMREAVTAAIAFNVARADYVLSDAYDEEFVGRKDPYLFGKTREETHAVFLQRLKRNVTLLTAFDLE